MERPVTGSDLNGLRLGLDLGGSRPLRVDLVILNSQQSSRTLVSGPLPKGEDPVKDPVIDALLVLHSSVSLRCSMASPAVRNSLLGLRLGAVSAHHLVFLSV